MSTTPARQPAGVPVGGQFAARSNPESDVELDDVAGAPVTPDFGAPFGGTAYTLPGGRTVTMWRKGQRVRFYDESGSQVGPEQSNVAPAVAYAHANGWDAAMGPSDSSAFWTQHVDSADIDPTSVSGQLQAADAKFDRPAAPAVFAEYQEFMKSGRYPYIDDVVGEVVKKHGVPEDLHKQLGHEVYLSSGQFKLGLMTEREADLTELGYRPITEFEPVAGAKVRFPDGVTYRVKEDGRGGWALLPPGKRTHGLSLGMMVVQHRAYESAKALGQLSLNDPKVRMFTSPAVPSRRSR